MGSLNVLDWRRSRHWWWRRHGCEKIVRDHGLQIKGVSSKTHKADSSTCWQVERFAQLRVESWPGESQRVNLSTRVDQMAEQ